MVRAGPAGGLRKQPEVELIGSQLMEVRLVVSLK